MIKKMLQSITIDNENEAGKLILFIAKVLGVGGGRDVLQVRTY